MKRFNVGRMAWVFIIVGVSSIAAAVFCAFYFSDIGSSSVDFMPFVGRFPLEQYAPIFLIAGLPLLAIGWILRDYALKHPVTEAEASEPTSSATPSIVGRSRKALTVAIALQVIALGVIISTYVMANTSVASAANECFLDIGDFEARGETLLANLTIHNPSSMDLRLNTLRASISISYDYANTYLAPVGTVNVSDQFLPAYSEVSVPVSMQISADLVDFLSIYPYGYDIEISSKYSITGTWLFVTITKDATAFDKYRQLED